MSKLQRERVGSMRRHGHERCKSWGGRFALSSPGFSFFLLELNERCVGVHTLVFDCLSRSIATVALYRFSWEHCLLVAVKNYVFATTTSRHFLSAWPKCLRTYVVQIYCLFTKQSRNSRPCVCGFGMFAEVCCSRSCLSPLLA